MRKLLVTMMALALTIGAQAQQYDGINTYTYDYGLCGRTALMRLHFTPSHLFASHRHKVETIGLRQ